MSSLSEIKRSISMVSPSELTDFLKRRFRKVQEAKEISDRVAHLNRLLILIWRMLQDRESLEDRPKLEALYFSTHRLFSKYGGEHLCLWYGKEFDPSFHEAVGIESSSFPEKTISQVITFAYRFGERVYAAKVMVSQK